MKPDLILAWPRNCDYPLWREYINNNRSEFNEIIIIFTETNQGADYREFLRKALFRDHVLCVDSPVIRPGEDWRNVAVNSGILHSYNARWIMFMEQDFFIERGFWDTVTGYEHQGLRAIGVKDAERLHPCCLLLRRDLLQELDKNFGIVPDKLDHFGLIQKQLEEKNEPIGIIPEVYYHHMNGLSHNWTLLERGEQPNWKPDEFNAYLGKCLKVNVPLNENFVRIAVSRENAENTL